MAARIGATKRSGLDEQSSEKGELRTPLKWLHLHGKWGKEASDEFEWQL